MKNLWRRFSHFIFPHLYPTDSMPTELYVSVDGWDLPWRKGISGKPLRTIRAAMRRIPSVMRHEMKINLGPGKFNLPPGR